MGGFFSKNLELPEEKAKKYAKYYKMEREEVKNCYKDFIIDCPTGEMNFDTFHNIMKTEYSTIEVRNISRFLFNAIDLNGDGIFNFSDYLAVIQKVKSKHNFDKLSVLFNILDTEKKKLITYRDLCIVFKELFLLLGEDESEIINSISICVTALYQELNLRKKSNINAEQFYQLSLNR
ncbi:hypothetical protein SNEBB_009592 [Seison nebaliae]|nr:hypothetical protein SNEBB_009592 [Seison nebaliae]